MRTNTGRLGQSLKKLAMILMVATLSVACGKNNTSGKSSDGPGGGTFAPGVGDYNYYSGEFRQALFSSSPCLNGSQARLQDVSPVQTQVGPGIYAGVTSEGDIAIIQNGVLELHMCQRPGLTGQGQVTIWPKVNDSKYCQVDEITQMQVKLLDQNGYPYTLNFRALHFGATAGASNLCGGMAYAY